MIKSVELPKPSLTWPNIRNITISGRIGAGATTLAGELSRALGWRNLEGGEVFWEAVRSKLGLSPKDTDLRPDSEDKNFDEMLKRLLSEKENYIVETKLAGFNAQGISGVFKILLVCEDEEGIDQTAIRIDRLVNREKISVEEAKEEVIEREKNDLNKWRALYARDDKTWVYWDKKYYDLVINTYSHNQEETLKIALGGMGSRD